MKRKHILIKEFFEEIKKSKNRFLSILLIVLLGVAFFSGVRAAGPDMRLSADIYYDEAGLMDIRVLSTMGLTDSDVSELEKVEGVKKIYPSFSTDLMVSMPDEQPILHLMTCTDEMNKITVTEGRAPEKANEIFLDASFMTANDLHIGDVITLINDAGEQDIDEILYTNEFTIVGCGNSPFYLSLERGSTSIGNGSVDGFGVLHKDAFCLDVYTELYIALDNTQDMICYSDTYEDSVDEIIDNIKLLEEERCQARLDEVKADAQKEIDDAQKEVDDAQRELDEAKEELEDGSKQLNDGKKELEEKEKELEDGKTEFEENEQLLKDGEQQLASAREELASKQSELNSSKKQLEDAKNTLNQKQAQLDAGFAELETQRVQLDAAEAQLAEGKASYEAGMKELTSKKAELEENRPLIEQAKAQIPLLEEKRIELKNTIAMLEDAIAGAGRGETPDVTAPDDTEDTEAVEDGIEEDIEEVPDGLEEALAQAKAGLAECEYTIAMIQEQIAEFESGEQQIAAYEETLAAGKAELDENEQKILQGREQLAAAQNELEQGRQQIQAAAAQLEQAWAQIASGESQLSAAQDTLAEKEEELAEGRAELEEARATIEDGEKQIADAKDEINEKEQELKDAQEEYDSEASKAEKELADAREDIAKAQEELDELEKPEWYVLGRNTLETYVEYGQNSDRIEAIGNVFPAIFFLVAALICLTTMTRMVEENRTQIGTLKALGYTKPAIAAKYLCYAFFASFTGSLIGLLLGQKLLPVIIINAYKILYNNLPVVQAPLHLGYSVSSTILAVAVTTLAAAFACQKELRAVPAQLMRPAAPQNGKRILLERVTFFWRHLNFSNKATARNLFRYKKRFLMTVLGIGGCMGLLMVGFGLRDSIMTIGEKQFQEIRTYSSTITLEKDDLAENRDALLQGLEEDSFVEEYMETMEYTADVGHEDTERTAYIMVIEDREKADDFIKMRNRVTQETCELNDEGVVITEKLATLLDVKAGDSVYIKDGDTKRMEVRVLAVAENYFFHYVYITPSLYEELYEEEPEYTSIFTINKDNTEEEEEAFQSKYMQYDGVSGVAFLSSTEERIAGMLRSMDSVIYVIVIAAGLLAFVVLYNLNNINISERRRELATLKVLGFYEEEVSAYVFRENVVLTVLGAMIGVIFGLLLHRFVILTAEIDIMMFGRKIKIISYFYSVLLTFLFSFLVNLFMHFKLKRLDMVESMKSVE